MGKVIPFKVPEPKIDPEDMGKALRQAFSDDEIEEIRKELEEEEDD